MAFLGLLIVASLFAADVDDLHAVGAAYDPANGIFYDCASISHPSSPTDTEVAEARQKCLDTKWCVWQLSGTNGRGACANDICLKYLSDSDPATACTNTQFGAQACQLKYLTDGWDCTDYTAIQTDRFCRVSTAVGTYERALIDTCFYTDLKSIALDRTGPRLCTGATCSNKSSSAGGYCAVTGNDCSLFDKNTNDYCNCLGPTNCDLYPNCFKNSSSTCVYDTCTDPSLVQVLPSGILTPATENSQCYFMDGTTATNCKVRPQYVYVPGAASATVQWFCVDKNKAHPNECYGAVKSTLVHPTIPGCDGPNAIPCSFCDTYTYDDSVCTANPILSNDGGAGINPPGYGWSPETNCTLVDIAENYVGPTAGKYCTDGDRTVPSPSAGNLVRIPSVVAFALALVAAFFL